MAITQVKVGWLGSLVVMATQWSWVWSPAAALSTGCYWDEWLFKAGIWPRCVPSHPGQLSFLSSVGWKLSTGQSAVICCRIHG